MKNSQIFALLLAVVSMVLLVSATETETEPIGMIFPTPKEVQSTGEKIKLNGEVEIFWSPTFAPPDNYREINAAINGIIGKIDGTGDGKKLNLLVSVDSELESQHYKIDFIKSEHALTVMIVAGDVRGVYYAAATLRQMCSYIDGMAEIAVANVFDGPVWKHRLVSDVLSNAELKNYQTLAANKISGICWRTEGNWMSPEWMAENKPALDAISQASGIDLADTMIQMHIYPKNGKQFNLTNEKEIQNLISAVKMFSAAGASAIMIAVDDYTPRIGNLYTYPTEEEKTRFGENAGRGHGYLMKRIHEAVQPEYPDVLLCMVVAPYAMEIHGIELPEIKQYFIEWGEESPDEVGLVWTGRYVFSPKVTAEEAGQVKALIGDDHPLIMFSNGNGIAPAMPRWETDFYSGMEADSKSTILLWGSYFIRPHERIYYLGANAYLWSPELYCVERDYKAAAAALHGCAAAESIWMLQDVYQSVLAKRSTGDRDGFGVLLDQFEIANAAISQFELPFSESMIEEAREYFSYKRPICVIQEKSSSKISLAPRGGDDKAMPADVNISFDDNGLKLHFNIVNPVLAIQEELPPDSPVYLNSDNIEIYIQPAPAAPEWVNSEPPSNGYVHLCFDSAGNKFDAIGCSSEFSYNPEWSVSTSRTETGWSAEVFIPYKAFDNEKLNFVKPAPGVVWRANFHRVNNQANLVESFGRKGDSFHMPDYFGELHFSAAPSDVSCEGSYNSHLQGVDMNEKGEYFWSFTDKIVKTSNNGEVIVSADVQSHHGDLCCFDGNIYVTCSIINDYAKGAESGKIFVYSQKDLKKIAEIDLVDNLGCDGITTTPEGFAVCVLVPPADNQSVTRIYEYDRDFNFIRSHEIKHPPLYSGIQVLSRRPDGKYLAGAYGFWLALLKEDFSTESVYRLDASVGIISGFGNSFHYAVHHSKKPDGWAAHLEHEELASLEEFK